MRNKQPKSLLNCTRKKSPHAFDKRHFKWILLYGHQYLRNVSALNVEYNSMNNNLIAFYVNKYSIE